MKAKGPLLTLLAVVVLALVLLAVNLTTKSEDGPTSPTAQSATPASPPAPAPAPAPSDPGAPGAPAAPPAADAQPFPAQASYTGKTSGRKVGEASVAVAVHDGRASAYLCDGKKLESWLGGQVQGSSFTLTGKNGDQITGSLSNGQLTGQVTAEGGKTWPYAAAASTRPAGLYRARGGSTDAGWIVYPDGKQTGVLSINGQAAAAPPLDPAAGNAVLGGQTLPVQAIQGGDAASVGGG